MIIGRLRQRVTVQQRTLSLDAGGAATYTWAAAGTVWAEVRSPAGLERFAPEADQVMATLTHTVRMRKPTFTVTPAMRLLWGTRVLEIQSVTDPDNRGEAQLLYCSELIDT